MACGCGKKVKAVMNIVEGNVKLLEEKVRQMVGDETEYVPYVAQRLERCLGCGQLTWMTVGEYAGFLMANAVDVVKEFGELEKLPNMTRFEKHDGAGMYCRRCKCYLPAKARVKDMECPMGRWIGIKVLEENKVPTEKENKGENNGKG